MTSDTVDKARTRNQQPFAESGNGKYALRLDKLDAILFDLDGVVTDTAGVHAKSWKTMFDSYLEERAARLGGTFHPFSLARDYERYVDGKPRYEGVASFLQSRGIYLQPGGENDSPRSETVCGLGNRKNEYFLDAIRRDGVNIYRASVEFIRQTKEQGLKVAVVSSSRNCTEILDAAGLADLFDAQVDGLVAREWMLDGKPAPDTFLEAAHRVGVEPGRACVVEDAIAGVKAGKAGKFAVVIGVDRRGGAAALKKNGADIVVSNLDELVFEGGRTASMAEPCSALDRLVEIRERIGGRRPVVFLDYDGTLTPIVERPELAVMSHEMRETLMALAGCCPVLIVSGRSRSDVQRLVGLENVFYAGSHGFDIAGPEGMRLQHEEGEAYVPVIAHVADELRDRLAPINGTIVEDKKFDVAAHFRMVRPEDVGRVEKIVDDVLAEHPCLRKSRGKKVFELGPNINWDKGKAVLWLLHALDLDKPDFVPLYLGDDVTDHDAFEAIQGKGISILVSDTPQPTPADYCLADPAEVRRFLRELTAMTEVHQE